MKRTRPFPHLTRRLRRARVGLVLFSSFFCFACLSSYSHAQAQISSSGLNTQVSGPVSVNGSTQFNITGGTRPNDGLNLFHSFGDFGVPTNNIANFLNETGLPTSNILGRVTGGNISNIFGTIQTTNFGNANLFLMNPAGFLFGPNATVNVGGMVAFTSADYLRLTDNARFNATPNAAADALLTASPVAAFGFLGSTPGAITVQGSQFTVTEGTGISLVGGNITIESGTLDSGVVQPAVLSAPAGRINFASAASPGEFLAGTLEQAPNSNSQSFGALGEIQISQKSLLDVSGNGGGNVLIRGGRFLMDDSMIFANVTGPDAGPPGDGIDIVVSQDAVLQKGAILDTSVLGNATPGVQYGGVHVKADHHIEVRGIADFDTGNIIFTTIQSNVAPSSTGGNSGDITLEANSILVKDLGDLHSITQGSGNAGNIIMRAKGDIEIQTSLLESSLVGASGNAGNFELTSTQGDVLLTNGSSVTSQSDFFGNGSVGSIAVNAPSGNILLTGSPIFGPATLFTAIDGTGANAAKGGIQLTAKTLTIENSGIQIDNFTPFQPGSLTVNLTGRLSMSGTIFNPTFNSTLLTTTRRSARSADLNITAHDVLLTDGALVATETFRSGDAGTLNIFTENLQITNGAQIRSSSRFNPVPDDPITTPSGAGGTISIQGLTSPAQSVLIDGPGSGIFTDTQGTGAGGDIFVNANLVTLQNGGTLSAKTSGTDATATGGTITVNATNQVTMTGRASITASSTGPGNAGNISINAGQQFEIRDSSVETEAEQARGGNIDIQAVDSVRLVNSTISTSVLGGAGSGGNITVDPNVVVVQNNSQILTTAVQGAGGNITITTPLFLADSTSLVSASSQFGLNGTVTIQSPTSNLSESLGPLASKPNQAQNLLTQRCAALANGQASSFVVAGREQLPADPGSWLTSPLAFTALGENLGAGYAVASTPAIVAIAAHDTDTVSLRRLTPAGFLIANFADSEATGCHS